MGLLDSFGGGPSGGGLLGSTWNDPRSMATLQLAAGLLGGQSFGQGLSRGLLGYQQSMANAGETEQAALKTRAAQLQVEEAERQARNALGLEGLQSQFFKPGTPARVGTGDVNDALPADMRIGAQPAQAGTAPQFDVNGYTSAALNQGFMTPTQAIQMQQLMAKESGVDKIDPKAYTPASLAKFAATRDYGALVPRDKLEFVEGVGVNPYDSRNANRAIPNPNKPFSMGPDGQVVPNLAFQRYETNKAAAGAARTNVNVNNVSTQETEQSKTYGKQLGDIRAGIMNAGFVAPSQLAKLDRLEQLMADVGGGNLTKLGMTVASAANSFGIKLDPKLGAKEAAQALATQVALGMRQPGSGPTTDKDFDNLMSTVPDLVKTPEGRKQIFKTMRAGLQRDIQASKFSRAYAEQNRGVINDGYFDALAEFYAKNPVVTGAPTPAPSAGGGASGSKGVPGDIANLLNKYK